MSKNIKKSVNWFILCLLVLSLTLSFSMPTLVSAANVDLLQQFDMEQVRITDPYYTNAFDKEVAYLQAIDYNRLLVGFKQTAGISTSYTRYGGGWEDALIQGHTMGHYMMALAQAYKNSKSNTTLNTSLKNRIDDIITQLKACQDRNGNGYLFATTSTQFDVVEGKVSGSSWVPWYTMHKIMSGLIAVYNLEGNATALTIANNLGNWIYNRVNGWNSSTQSRVLGVEYGGMNDCLYELYKLTGNNNHLSAAHKFDETSLFTTIASGNNVLPGKHANCTIPKFIGALNRYRTIGSSESAYLTAAQQFFTIVLRDCTYVTGGNSQDEHFRTAGQLNAYRDNLNNETCNVHNMLKLARGLFMVTGDVKYADYYENAYINEIMASQNPDTGMATYFKAMGTGYFKVFSSQFNHFWCCTGTGMENFTKLNDSIYFNNGTDLYVNMYLSSTLNWSAKGLSLTQQANIPLSNTVTFTINSAPTSAVKIKFRSPSWVAAGQSVTVKVNGATFSTSAVNGYLDVSRVWAAGDTVELTIPAEVKISRLTDNQNVVAFTYGPVVLSAGLGTASMTTTSHGVNVLIATKNVTVKDTIRVNASSINDWLNNIKTNLVQTAGKLEFTLRNTDSSELVFIPHYSRYTDRYGIYFTFAMGTTPTPTPTQTPTQTPTPTPGGVIVSSGHTYKLVNRNSSKVLGISNMSTSDGANALQWSDNGTADHNWTITLVNGYYRLKNQNSGKVLGINGMSTSDGANAVQWSDNGTADHDWTMTNTGSGIYKLVNRNSGKVLGISNMSTSDGATAVQWSDNGTADHLWTLILVN